MLTSRGAMPRLQPTSCGRHARGGCLGNISGRTCLCPMARSRQICGCGRAPELSYPTECHLPNWTRLSTTEHSRKRCTTRPSGAAPHNHSRHAHVHAKLGGGSAARPVFSRADARAGLRSAGWPRSRARSRAVNHRALPRAPIRVWMSRQRGLVVGSARKTRGNARGRGTDPCRSNMTMAQPRPPRPRCLASRVNERCGRSQKLQARLLGARGVPYPRRYAYARLGLGVLVCYVYSAVQVRQFW